MVKGQAVRHVRCANASTELLQRCREPYQVVTPPVRGEVNVAGWRDRCAVRDGREGADDDVAHAVLVQHGDDRSGIEPRCLSGRMVAHVSVQGNGVSPILDLPISARTLRPRTPALEHGKSLVVRVLKREIHPQLEAGRL